MKILYLTPKINSEGGLERVVCLKANYLADVFGHEVHLLTQNNLHTNPFYNFSESIQMHSMSLNGNKIIFLKQYIQSVKKVIQNIKPDVVIVCDGLKGFFLPFFLNSKIPFVFESHGSVFNAEKKPSNIIFYNLQIKFKKYAASKFDKFVVLSQESANEWNVANSVIIPNPNWIKNTENATLTEKKIIVIARHSYEKGIDRLLEIWKIVEQKFPDWSLHIYGSSSNEIYPKLALDMGMKSIHFHPPTKHIEQKYLESSVLLMTSRYEGFPMALLEAMCFGLPCIAYDCPIGPRAIIEDKVNGFLIKDGNVAAFSEKVLELIENKDLRKKI
jgi:glycosyltransferase involved in cell wall biosynthesis